MCKHHYLHGQSDCNTILYTPPLTIGTNLRCAWNDKDAQICIVHRMAKTGPVKGIHNTEVDVVNVKLVPVL